MSVRVIECSMCKGPEVSVGLEIKACQGGTSCGGPPALTLLLSVLMTERQAGPEGVKPGRCVLGCAVLRPTRQNAVWRTDWPAAGPLGKERKCGCGHEALPAPALPGSATLGFPRLGMETQWHLFPVLTF